MAVVPLAREICPPLYWVKAALTSQIVRRSRFWRSATEYQWRGEKSLPTAPQTRVCCINFFTMRLRHQDRANRKILR